MQMPSLGKNPTNYEVERKKTCEYEQKPISFNDFNDAEEEIKKCAAKRKERQRELAEYLKAQKQQKRETETKEKEEELWQRLGELNWKFKNIKKAKKRSQKNVREN